MTKLLGIGAFCRDFSRNSKIQLFFMRLRQNVHQHNSCAYGEKENGPLRVRRPHFVRHTQEPCSGSDYARQQ